MIFYREITPFVNSIYEVQDLCLDLDKIRNQVDELSKNKDIWFDRFNGAQTYNQTELNDPCYNELFNDKISPVVKSILTSWGINSSPKLKLYFTNIDKRGGFSHSHSHINSVLSGVVYITVPEKSGDIVFARPDFQEYQFKIHNPLTAYTNNNYRITPKENMMLIFPSYIKHSVEPHNFSETEKRISIAFDYGFDN